MDCLFGSSILPATIYIGSRSVQLGTIVRRAFRDSGLTDSEWNELAPLEREHRLCTAVYAMRAEAATTVNPR